MAKIIDIEGIGPMVSDKLAKAGIKFTEVPFLEQANHDTAHLIVQLQNI